MAAEAHTQLKGHEGRLRKAEGRCHVYVARLEEDPQVRDVPSDPAAQVPGKLCLGRVRRGGTGCHREPNMIGAAAAEDIHAPETRPELVPDVERATEIVIFCVGGPPEGVGEVPLQLFIGAVFTVAPHEPDEDRGLGHLEPNEHRSHPPRIEAVAVLIRMIGTVRDREADAETEHGPHALRRADRRRNEAEHYTPCDPPNPHSHLPSGTDGRETEERSLPRSRT